MVFTYNNVACSKTLGVVVDENLKWNDHIDYISKKIASGLGAIKRIKPFVPMDTLILIYNALVKSHIEYCCEVWDSTSKASKDRLQIFQNRAARLILGTDNRVSSTLVLGLLNWDNLEETRAKRKGLLMHTIYNKTAPERLVDLFSLVSSSTSYNLRGANSKFIIPRPNTECLKKSFSYNGALIWNSLPPEMRDVQSYSYFHKMIAAKTIFST